MIEVAAAARRVSRVSLQERFLSFRRPPLPVLLALALVLVTALPYLYASLVQPSDHVFLGFFYVGDDATSYLANMRQGWEGNWLWVDRYTTEPAAPILVFLPWLLLGKLAALLHLSLGTAFQLARVAGAFALLGGAWAFIRHFLAGDSGAQRARRFALFLLAFGLGIGYVIQALGHPTVLGQRTETLDWRMPELSGFYSILALPHYSFSGALIAVGSVLTLRALQQSSFRLAALAGAAWAAEALIHVQMVVLLAGVLAFSAALTRLPWRRWAVLAVSFVPALPYLAYVYFVLQRNPEAMRLIAQGGDALAPDAVSLLLALLPQLALAAVAVPRALRRRSLEDLFLVLWLAAAFYLLWFPSPFETVRRRFLEAIYLPLVVLAARGLYAEVLPRVRSVKARNLAPFAFVAFASVGSAFLVLAPLAVATSSEYTLPRAQFQALQWLGSQPPGIVLASPQLGLEVPAYTPDTAFAGHYGMTYRYGEKAAQATSLLGGRGDLAAFASTQHLRYVIWTASDAATPPRDLGSPAYAAPGVEIFRLY